MTASATDTKRPTRASRKTGGDRPWVELSLDQLLDVRLCDLDLRIEGTDLVPRIRQLLAELRQRKLAFRPHCWLAEEWFSPDGVPGIAIPFYLAHPRLAQLQQREMLEVEGGTAESCMRILRHEAGHAMDNAFRLRRKKRWQQVFGKSSQPYPDTYQPRPYSRRFVQHLAAWYAQSHPCEDFAETFAVWLTPGLDWRARYAGWPALRKLEFVDTLMAELADTPPPVTTRSQFEHIRYIRTTLRRHYQEKRERYDTDSPEVYDRDLRRVFSEPGEQVTGASAARFLRRIRPELRRRVAYCTNAYQYMIDRVLRDMIERCRVLNLRVKDSEEQTKMDATILLTAQAMNYLHKGRHRIAL